MSYNTLIVMANDGDLQQRFIAAATGAGVENPRQWVLDNFMKLVSNVDVANSYTAGLNAYNTAVAAVETARTAVPSAAIGKSDSIVADSRLLAAVNLIKPTPAV